MKKSIIIGIIAVVVIAVVYFVLKSKNESTDKDTTQETDAEREAREAAEKEEADAAARQAVIDAYSEQRSTEILNQSTTENELKEYGIERTAEEIKEQATLANKYNEYTGLTIGNEMSLEDLRLEVARLEEAYEILQKIKTAFPEATYDVNYATEITLANDKYDTADELTQKYNSLVARRNEIDEMAKTFADDLQVGMLWEGASTKTKMLSLLASGGFSALFKKSPKFSGWSGWDIDNIREMLKLTYKERKQFDTDLKEHFSNFYENTGKNDKMKNAKSTSDWGLNTSNVTTLTILNMNKKRSTPEQTTYFRERDKISGNVTYDGQSIAPSMALYYHFSKTE